MAKRGLSLLLVLLVAAVLGTGGCGSKSSSTPASMPSATSTLASGAPAGGDAPAQLIGTWRLASRDSPERGLLFIISQSHYRVPNRFASGDLAVDGDEIAFFNATLCGLTLPDGVGRYRWSVEGDTLRFQPVGEEPCGGRKDILAGTVYHRVG